MRIVILWTFQADYLASLVKAFTTQGDNVLLALQRDNADIPATSFPSSVDVLRDPEEAELKELIRKFNPDIALIAGWHIPIYRRIASALTGIPRVMAIDNQWRGTVRQHLGSLAFKLKLKHLYTHALTPGPRQVVFAQRMKFPSNRILLGSIPCNSEIFYHEPGSSIRDRAFLSVSRLAPEKGIDTLLAAYAEYRASAPDPWDLRIAGRGPIQIPDHPGVKLLGPLVSSTVASELRRAGAFVTASNFEPWGVAIHEAAATGTPVIATDACGAADAFVLNGLNGFIVESGSVSQLSDAMRSMTQLSDDDRRSYGDLSAVLAGRSTPQALARSLRRVARQQAN